MRSKLRQVGNSVGLTIPASELQALGAEVGDMVEIEIKQVIRVVRDAWDDPQRWPGANDEPLLLDEIPGAEFDDQDWQW